MNCSCRFINLVETLLQSTVFLKCFSILILVIQFTQSARQYVPVNVILIICLIWLLLLTLLRRHFRTTVSGLIVSSLFTAQIQRKSKFFVNLPFEEAIFAFIVNFN